ncbi:MAG: hypothetical protein C6W57_08280 [Caldibacillus debilis]|nr:MAG: hypothetical protein C6W57_08280 [Caldibacillus debilis]
MHGAFFHARMMRANEGNSGSEAMEPIPADGAVRERGKRRRAPQVCGPSFSSVKMGSSPLRQRKGRNGVRF